MAINLLPSAKSEQQQFAMHRLKRIITILSMMVIAIVFLQIKFKSTLVQQRMEITHLQKKLDQQKQPSVSASHLQRKPGEENAAIYNGGKQNRTSVAILMQIPEFLPGDIVLTKIENKNAMLIISGIGFSNSEILMFMKNIESSMTTGKVALSEMSHQNERDGWIGFSLALTE